MAGNSAAPDNPLDEDGSLQSIAMKRFDVLVRGDGPVGCCLALALARQGLQVGAQKPAPRAVASDLRAWALNPRSVAWLEALGVWQSLVADARTPVYDMQVRGDAAGGHIDFSAYEQRVRELAFIVDAAELQRKLNAALAAAGIDLIGADDDATASLVALADGKDSASRESLGIREQRHDYGQAAIAARLTSEETHRNIAHQWFRHPDVLALLPFDRPQPDRSFALVWSMPAARAELLMACEPAAFEQALNEATALACGALRVAGERAAWSLRRAHAERWSGPGWVLLGDAAHVVHPLAGQGLNLGLADAQALARIIEAREPWREPGDQRLLRRYARERALPTRAMEQMTDGLLQLFAHDATPVRELRNRGLTLLHHLGPVKRWLTARALDN